MAVRTHCAARWKASEFRGKARGHLVHFHRDIGCGVGWADPSFRLCNLACVVDFGSSGPQMVLREFEIGGWTPKTLVRGWLLELYRVESPLDRLVCNDHRLGMGHEIHDAM